MVSLSNYCKMICFTQKSLSLSLKSHTNNNDNNNNSKSHHWKKHRTILNSIDMMRPANDTCLLSRNWEIYCIKDKSLQDVRPNFGLIPTSLSTKKHKAWREHWRQWKRGNFDCDSIYLVAYKPFSCNVFSPTVREMTQKCH